jgi:hypothetical protein
LKELVKINAEFVETLIQGITVRASSDTKGVGPLTVRVMIDLLPVYKDSAGAGDELVGGRIGFNPKFEVIKIGTERLDFDTNASGSLGLDRIIIIITTATRPLHN